MSLNMPRFCINAASSTPTYPFSLHDALPICERPLCERLEQALVWAADRDLRHHDDLVLGHGRLGRVADRKSTRLNSSHTVISYAVFCLKKKNHACDSSNSMLHAQRP